MGLGAGLFCPVTLNSSLSEGERALYQDPETVKKILNQTRTIAIVGLSSDRQKASYFVASYLRSAGYRIIPVNPKAGRILGRSGYHDLGFGNQGEGPLPHVALGIARAPQLQGTG